MNLIHDAIIVVQARMESTRLPGKVLKPLEGIPLIFHLLNRLQTIPCKDLITAVSNAEESVPLVNALLDGNYKIYQGHPLNVYERFMNAIRNTEAKAIVRITADNPLTDCDVIPKGIEKLNQNNLDYLWIDNSPCGLGCDIFKTETFKSFQNVNLTAEESEHLVPIFRNRPELKGGTVKSSFPENADKLRLTVDTLKDYQKMCDIFKKYFLPDHSLDLSVIVNDLLTQTKIDL